MSSDPYTSPSTGRPIRAIAFDTFGTLVDWRTGIIDAFHRYAHRNTLTLDAPRLADAWRAQYQPSMEPIRSGHRPYTSLDTLHRESLTRILTDAQHPTDPGDIEDLATSWHHLPAWPDVRNALRTLRQTYPISPLSNAHTALLITLSRHNRFEWDTIIGSDIARTYKPDPRATTQPRPFTASIPARSSSSPPTTMTSQAPAQRDSPQVSSKGPSNTAPIKLPISPPPLSGIFMHTHSRNS